jgi:hypothetical protein
VLNSTFVLIFGIGAELSICAFNPHLRKAPNRYAPLITPAKRTHQEIFAQSKINNYF